MNYRCVKSNTSYDCLCIANDYSQSGDYHGVGTWKEWTFGTIPTVATEVWEYAEANHYMGNLHKVIGDEILAKSIADIQSE